MPEDDDDAWLAMFEEENDDGFEDSLEKRGDDDDAEENDDAPPFIDVISLPEGPPFFRGYLQTRDFDDEWEENEFDELL